MASFATNAVLRSFGNCEESDYLMKTGKYALIVVRAKEINTDPRGRCYNGCHYSSEWVKEKPEVYTVSDDKEQLDKDCEFWNKLNAYRHYEYSVVEYSSLNPEEVVM